MHSFFSCVLYLMLSGVAGFLLGRILPKSIFHGNCFPYKSFAFEKGGKIYQKMNIHYWQNKVPDMSRILPWCMPAKNMAGDYQNRLSEMIQETCVAEMIHALLCITGLYCLKLYPGVGGVLVVLIYIIVFNLPYIFIQRYNRPRLMRIEKKMRQKQANRRSMEPA